MISVVVPTNRCGGLDVLFGGLAKQTDRDFELILVDALWKYRRELVAQRARDYSFPVRHIPPRENRFPEQQFCRTVNTGIAHARGDIILLLCDYSFTHEDCLATHAELQAKHPGPVTLDYRYLTLPTLKAGLKIYRETTPGTEANADAYRAEVADISERYAADVRAGRRDSFMWSIFLEGFGGGAVEHEHKPSGADLANDWNWCSFKNESFPMELLLELNGCDEAYDRSHAWQDSELSYRLRERGIRWHASEPGRGLVSVINPRHIMNIKNMAEPLFYNRELCFGSRRAELRLPVNPGFSLREWRERTLREAA